MMHHLIKSIIATAFCVATCCLAPHTLPADESQQPKIEGVPTKTLPIDGQVFEIEGRTAFLIPPESVRPGQAVPWIWYAPTLPNLPSNAEEWMFRRFTRNGIAIAGIDVGESYGSPAGSRLYTLLYEHLVSKGFSSRPILLGRSRGGLMTLSWAADHPDRVGAFAGIYPVCNLASYPGLDRACGAFQLSAQELSQRLKEFNPIDRLGPLAKAGVPMFSIHGDVDTVVPLEKNSGMMRDRYVALGGQMQLIVPKGQGHNMWKGFFECEELMAFIRTHAFEFGELIFEDTFERDERQELKDEPGNGWTTSSDTTAGGHKQVDLREGSMFIETHKTANHAASVRHPFEFQNGVIELRLMLPSDTDSLNINIADPEFKDVHAGHLFSVKVSTTHITIEDLATGVMKTSIRTARQNGQLTNEQQSMLSKLKLSTAHAIAKNEWHHIVIQIHKDQAKVLIDGRQIAEFQSPGIAHPNKRLLRLLPPEAAVVDDVRIWRSVATSHRPAAVSHQTAQMKLSQPMDYQVVQRTPDNAGRVRVSGTLEDAPSREQTVILRSEICACERNNRSNQRQMVASL
ncbi:MAG: prolyl oligopeptidase family serine peptidase [Planctomycetaceae bacterium]|nr:prolyl oligopeptidase family serine peptidase [Planctomycetaceae bacterium]